MLRPAALLVPPSSTPAEILDRGVPLAAAEANADGSGPWAARVAVALALGAGLATRLALLPRDLPYYAVDENDVVEPALAVLSGEWDPRWYQYGSLGSYMLAGLFALAKAVAAAIVGWNESDFYYAAFFRPAFLYVLARALFAAVSLGGAWLMARVGRRAWGPAAGVAGLVLGAAPLLDATAGFSVRVDTLQGLLGFAALALAASSGPHVTWCLAGSGALAGLSLAAKPVQGLLVLPALGLATLVAVARASRGRARPWRTALLHPGPWVAALALLAAHAVANPFGLRWLARMALAGLPRDTLTMPTTALGSDPSWFVALAGPPLALAVLLAVVVAVLDRDALVWVLLAHVLTVCGVYATGGVRPYWYNGVLPSLLMLTARLIARAGTRLAAAGRSPKPIAAVTALVLVAWPIAQAAAEAWRAWHPSPSLERRADRAAQLWIEGSVPEGSGLLLVGLYSLNLPRLVAETPGTHGEWAELFMYERSRQARFVERFKAAYRRHRRTGGPLYAIARARRVYSGSRGTDKQRRAMDLEIAALARAGGQRYVVTASPDRYRGAWESGPGVRLLARFGADSGHLGDEVKVFEIEPR